MSAALEAAAGQARPRTLLARVQEAWEEAAGPAVAQEAQPASERDGTIAVDCSSAVWAQELELLEPELRVRLDVALGGGGHEAVRALRFRVRGRS